MVVLGGEVFLMGKVPLYSPAPVPVKSQLSILLTRCGRGAECRVWGVAFGGVASGVWGVQGYLAHKKQRPPRTLQ